MASGTSPLCITCALPTGSQSQFNRLPNGQICPTCRDRLLDSIPAALPSAAHLRVPEMGEGSTELEELHGEPEWDGQRRPWPPTGLSS